MSFITLESSTTSASLNPLNNSFKKNKVNMLFVGLGDGCLLSFSLGIVSTDELFWNILIMMLY